MKKFILLPSVGDSHHVIDIALIASVSPKKGELNRSEIALIGSTVSLFSTATPIEIHKLLVKINETI